MCGKSEKNYAQGIPCMARKHEGTMQTLKNWQRFFDSQRGLPHSGRPLNSAQMLIFPGDLAIHHGHFHLGCTDLIWSNSENVAGEHGEIRKLAYAERAAVVLLE